MKFSEQWIREWVNPDVDTETLVEQLTMAGLEVDAVAPAAPDFTHVVVGEVLSIEPHPAADRLNLCQVNVGQSENLSIVCGASNVAKGVKVPTAIVGAALPGNFNIKKAKLRGVESFGMLCSAKEIGIADSAEGLLLLPEDAPVGQDIRAYLGLNDNIIDVDFTPNRGDCLSVAGIAREVGVLNDTQVLNKPVEKVTPTIDDTFCIEVDAKSDCPRYQGRVIKGINPRAETPLWMQERLRRAGLRSLSPTVDVTNYLLLELGQPMHAFDLAQLNQKIIVRKANKNEKLKLLDDSEVSLDEQFLVIADSQKAVAFAGVMGGLDSSVTDKTEDIFLECAYFQPDTIRGKARQFGMQTDSSYRFERGVDFNLQTRAMERATQLILDIAGGEAGPISEVLSETHFPQRKNIRLRKSRLKRVLGLSIDDKQVENILTRLGMSLQSDADGWQVIAPDYRFDIVIEADLVEEIGRVYGYNRLPTTMPHCDLRFVGEPETDIPAKKIRQLLVDRDYQEAITYSFVDEAIQRLLDPDNHPIKLANPISSDMSVMRTTLWASLLKAAEYNQARQQHRVRLFELGKRFIQNDAEVEQQTVIAGLAMGQALKTQWAAEARKIDFFDMKGDVEALLSLTGKERQFTFVAAQHPALHSGQSAQILCGESCVGWLGALHPAVQQKLGLNSSVFLFELAYTKLGKGVIPQHKSVSKFPSIKRDLALVVNEDIAAGTVLAEVNRSGGKYLQHVEIFDIFCGKGVAAGSKSLAMSLTIQDDTKTMTDADIEQIIQKILVSLHDSIGATLRE
ncbi:MAG TPA: phenylalanine--tRNA ligase subunit beta [Gammaproteobacteria bacterium]|nr:phenylalanine--tRNA ligase subunit beta [Gammaproteobacteria bacterium]